MEIESVLESNVVDLTSLKTFFASDKDTLIQIIQVYISDTEPRIKTLEESLTNIDNTEIKSISHFLKSSFSLMGIKCSEEIAELEKMADRKEKDSLIKEKLNYIISICKESIVEYKIIL